MSSRAKKRSRRKGGPPPRSSAIDAGVRGKGLYHQVYYDRVAAAISACRTIADLAHAGEKGRIRELLIASLFRPLLPADIEVGSGFILSATGEVSTQQDIVLYDRSTLPPALFDTNIGLYPVEAVLYAIEVKSTLTSAGLAGAHDAARRLAKFPLVDKKGKATAAGTRPGFLVFALDSDLSNGNNDVVSQYSKARRGESPAIQAICVVGRGYWHLKEGSFEPWPECYPLAEVMGFLGGIMNHLPEACEVRRQARPPIGAYLIDFGGKVFNEIAKGLDDFAAVVAIAEQDPTKADLHAVQDKLAALQAQIAALRAQYRPGTLAELWNGFETHHGKLRERVETLAGKDAARLDENAG